MPAHCYCGESERRKKASPNNLARLKFKVFPMHNLNAPIKSSTVGLSHDLGLNADAM